ncbi:hypothetical protein PCANC_19791 [Puccinia coronata f. sp. avenae]|uniref:Uncharacterized protein n=1 Tax=Puccinia coronata f. sp. avenae TaxID=200324 RepID=A0A2N5S9S1_9BASI|nr:hypothetical protein PCANC_19791 [Puccinia coronata f. sp. avenae]
MSYGAVDSCNTRVADTTQNKYGLYCTVQVRYWKNDEPLLAAGLPTPPALPQPIRSGRKPTEKNQPPRKNPKTTYAF